MNVAYQCEIVFNAARIYHKYQFNGQWYDIKEEEDQWTGGAGNA